MFLKKISYFAFAAALLCWSWQVTSQELFDSAAKCNTNTPPPVVVYFALGSGESEYWRLNKELAMAVAKSLNIQLDILTISPDHQHRLLYHKFIEDHISKLPRKPDYIVGPTFYQGITALFETIENLKIPYISLNASFLPREIKELGGPRELSPLWLGHISPNDRATAYKMAHEAIVDYSNDGKSLTSIIIAGRKADSVSILRVNGVMQALLEFGLMPNQIFYTDWTYREAYSATKAASKRFENIDIIFSVSDLISEGAHQALIDQNDKSITKIIGFDWGEKASKLVRAKRIRESYGGHFVESGLALLLAFDHFYGLDFKDTYNRTTYTTQMASLNIDNLDLVSNWIDNKGWQSLDFKQFSRCFNEQSDLASFSTVNFLRQHILSANTPDN